MAMMWRVEVGEAVKIKNKYKIDISLSEMRRKKKTGNTAHVRQNDHYTKSKIIQLVRKRMEEMEN